MSDGGSDIQRTTTRAMSSTRGWSDCSCDGQVLDIGSRAAEALDALPRRLHTRLVFPGPRGSYIDLRNWKKREWWPAVEASGLWTPPPKDQPRPRAVPSPVRPSTQLRRPELGRRHPGPRPRSLHGFQSADDRPDLRPPRAWFGGGHESEARCLRAGSRRRGRGRQPGHPPLRGSQCADAVRYHGGVSIPDPKGGGRP